MTKFGSLTGGMLVKGVELHTSLCGIREGGYWTVSGESPIRIRRKSRRRDRSEGGQSAKNRLDTVTFKRP